MNMNVTIKTMILSIAMSLACTVRVSAGACGFPEVDFGRPVPTKEQCESPKPANAPPAPPVSPPGVPRPAPPPSPPLAGVSAGDFVVDYNSEMTKALDQNAFSLTLNFSSSPGLNEEPKGTRIATKNAYESGKITARISSGMSAPGTIGGFYISSYEPERFEERVQYQANYELMGARGHRYIESNFFINGTGGNEDFHAVPDHDSSFHAYGFEWDVKAGFVKYLVDGKVIREINATGWPAQRVYWSVWGTKPCHMRDAMGLLQWAGLPRQSDYGKSYVMKVTDIKFTHSAPLPIQPVYRLAQPGKTEGLKTRLQRSNASLNPQLPAKEDIRYAEICISD